MMLLALSWAALFAITCARSVTQDPFLPPAQPIGDADFKIPSIHESTVMARRILHLSTLGTLVTTFPEAASHETSGTNNATAWEVRPAEVAGSPIGLMEYYADCEGTGDPTLLAIGIATPFRNYAAGSNISLHVRWWPERKTSYAASVLPAWVWAGADGQEDAAEIPTPHTPAALPRFSLHGRLEAIPLGELGAGLVPACFLRAHPDSVLWQPGNDVHTSQYMRLVVEQVYWFGGFGDRARIGWLPVEEWRNVTMEEVAAIRLPGEKKKAQGWRGWL